MRTADRARGKRREGLEGARIDCSRVE